ncbi:MAG: pathosis related protein [Clostridiaceae bacterium]|jgi:predicted ATP-dependent endonuclease of OLD family|nr:pathosis related protein [Clostridiaceae bacterium]
MYIKKIRIQNFRQLKDVELELQNNTTILAGPNNSGKTSFILLLKRMLLEKSFDFSKDDFNAYDKCIWSNKVYNILKSLYDNKQSKKEDEIIKELTDKMFPIENELESKPSVILPELIVKLQIDYDNNDDISNFANYIMDLDDSHNSFYFSYKIVLNKNLFKKGIKENWSKVNSRLNKNQNDNKQQSIIEIILDVYCGSLISKCYFTDENYIIATEIQSIQEFKNLFNFRYIEAARPLNDSLEKDKHLLSDTLIKLASKEEVWKTEIRKLPDEVLNTLDECGIKSKIEDVSTTALNKTIESITQTNGGHTGKLCLNIDVSEDHIENLIQSTTNAKYSISGEIIDCNYNLNETSQGLGYSNLIYMHSQIEDYIKSKDKLKVNFLVIEEPESHMHPQMQYVFANELLKQYDKEKLQGLLTTHSSELVRGTSIERLRVIREETLFNSKIYNLSLFINDIEIPKNSNEDDVVLIEDYKTFYEDIGIYEIIFADVAILYEGDTERLYLKKLLSFPNFKDLKQKYIAYIQVGGAYAYNFKPLLEFLKIKSLIITDIDYEKNESDEDAILDATTTNITIKKFYNINNENKDKPKNSKVKIKDLYNWINATNNIVLQTNKKDLNESEKKEDLIYLAFQTDKDKYTRTLEAAMLSKIFGMSGYELVKRSEWISKKKAFGLKYSIPVNKIKDGTKEKEDDSEFSLVDILNSTSNAKTDFMYSVILNNYAEKMLPDYIKEGLEWLMK